MSLYRWFTMSLIKLTCQGTHQNFLRACENPDQTQSELLRELLKAASQTERGKSLRLNGVESYLEFTQKVPIANYDQGFRSWADQQFANPKEQILSSAGVETFEKTSGSSGNFKLIPYNREMLKSFESYFRIWAGDILSKGPRFKSYRTFLSISPTLKSVENVGFSDDSQYLRTPLRQMIRPFLSVPLNIKNVEQAKEFWMTLARHLLNDSKLEIISVWHPSFLAILLEFITEHRLEIARQLKPGRTQDLLASDHPISWPLVWPELKFVSAWEEANSHSAAQALKLKFPQAVFQGKGLLATEAPMTIPLIGQGNLPFLTDIFFEFLDDRGRVFRLSEINEGDCYELVISQKSGLLRYAIGDRVRASSSKIEGLMQFEFLGRSQDISDLVGEKLSVENINRLSAKLFEACQIQTFCLLPVSESSNTRYTLIYESSQECNEKITQVTEEFLSVHYHYRYARELGQLARIEARLLPRLGSRLSQYYQTKKNQKAGDIKLKNFVTQVKEAEDLLDYLNAP